MTIFFITVLIPACAFFVYAFVNFQRELWNEKHNKFTGSQMVPILGPQESSSAPEPDIAVAPREAPAPQEGPSSGPANRWQQLRLTSDIEASREVYQPEVSFIGPLFLVRLRGQESDESPRVFEFSNRRAAHQARSRDESAPCDLPQPHRNLQLTRICDPELRNAVGRIHIRRERAL
jgi:hypothetical protein